MSDCEVAILQHLSTSPTATIADSYPWAASQNLNHESVVGAIKSLSAEFYINSTELTKQYYEVSKEGLEIIASGSPEWKTFVALAAAEGGLTQEELIDRAGKAAQVGVGKCMQNKWIQKGADGKITAIKSMDELSDSVQSMLSTLQDAQGEPTALDKKDATLLKKRKLIKLRKLASYAVVRGKEYAPQRVFKAADLTKDLLDSGAWKTTAFKNYNFQTLGESVGGGYLHPLLKVRAEFRKIFMQMGFEEMPTQKWVESSFWNFDSLFQPQSHPARDAHDTFFIKEPRDTVSVPEEYYERVKTMHEVGGSGSIGYRYDFKREEAFKNLLRTHTTAISSQMLYKLANQPSGFEPKRYFSIDRVFRNETMDATHLCEFHQVEGLVADYDLSLADLMGTIQTFFHKIGITELRFKPAFNPYTEPSMEIFGFHPGLGKWTEIGNSGMFRPEMLQPMGLPENVRVIAWGLSLERPTMIKYGISNIRDLFGHKVEMARTRTAPICRFEEGAVEESKKEE